MLCDFVVEIEERVGRKRILAPIEIGEMMVSVNKIRWESVLFVAGFYVEGGVDCI